MASVAGFSIIFVYSAALRLVPTRRPVLFLTRIGAIPGDLAPRADFEVLQMAQNLAPVVVAIRKPLHRCYAKLFERIK